MLRSDSSGEYVTPYGEYCNYCALFAFIKWSYWKKKSYLKGNDERYVNKFWIATELVGEAILSANYILNKVPQKKVDQTPNEQWNSRKPSY